MNANTRRCATRCVVMRGGTSRGVFFHAADLPRDAARRDAVLMAAIGASDPRQVDGLGGADLLLSKVAVVWPSERPDADVACSFGSIPPGSARVKYGSNCGNLSSAVACFARQEGLVAPEAERVRLHNPDSGVLMEARWCEWDQAARARFADTSGMPASGELLELAFLAPAGTATGRLLPTGRAVDCLEMPDGRPVEASIVDAGALYVFLRAGDAGLPLDVSTDVLRADAALAATCERLRGQAAVLAGLVARASDALPVTPAVPKLAFIRPPADFRTEGRQVAVAAGDVDVVGRIVSSQSFHKAYAVTGAIAAAAAATVPGSVVASAMGGHLRAGVTRFRIGHPTGVIECQLESRQDAGEPVVDRVTVLRTARRIMEGRCYVEESAA